VNDLPLTLDKSGYFKVETFKPGNKILGFIAIHNTNLGPALGGTRIFPYKNIQAACEDALRLSKAMTYKCAIAGVPFGGGKGVVMASPNRKNIKEVLKRYAQTISKLKGIFHTGEDVGLSEENVQYMLKFSPYFIGKSHLAGDPSPFAAQSAFLCAQVASKFVFGSEKMDQKIVTLKGAGKTGSALASLFAASGAKVYVADINPRAIKTLMQKSPSIVGVTTDELLKIKSDIYAPCALGNDIHKDNIKKIKADLIVGTANNQLHDHSIAETLHKQGMLHVPDYVANAGGLINVADELLPGGYNKKRVEQNIEKLKTTLEEILKTSRKKNTDPDSIANQKAENIFLAKQPVHKEKIRVA
jgi:glutamate dehydrogenase/leucine dehydrogenase